MRKHGIAGLAVFLSLMVLMIAGCQPGESAAVEQEAVTESEPSPQEVAKLAPVKESPKPAESVKPTDPAPAGPLPKIVMTKAIHDFGNVGPSSSHKADYAFKNEGEGTLLINRLQSTCGCSQPTLIKDGKRYDGKKPFDPPVAFEPGESGNVEVTFKAPVTKGDVKKNLYVLSNDPASPRTQFSVKAFVVVKVSVQPEKVDLKLDAENAGMPDIVVKSIDGQEFSIKSVFVAQNAIKIPFDPAEKATEFVLKPQVEIEKLGQSKTGVVQIKTTHPQAATLMVRYNIKPMYELTNPRYILKNIESGKTIVRENLIRSNYGKPIEIESATSRNGYMELEKQEKDGDHLRLTVKITPPDQDTSKRRYVTDELSVVLKDGYKLSIRCSGWFRLK